MYIVHTEASCGWGGQEIRILTEAEGMIGRGHRVEIWVVPGSTILEQAMRRGIPQHALPIGRKGLRGIMAMRLALASVRPDVVNTHSSTDTWLAALACLTLRDPPPLVRTRHISAPVPKDFATRWLYQHATRHIVTTGENLRHTLIRDNRLRDYRITSIPTGVDSRRFHPQDRTEARRQLGLDIAAKYIGIIATLRSWKGHLYLIDAFARLAEDDENLKLLIVGDGPMHEVLEQRIASLGLAPRVTLAGRQEAVETWLRAMDVFCLPSYANEGVPQALLQAMLTGLPVVTTPVGSITEAVNDGVTGLLVPPRDAAALADAFTRVLNDAGLSGRLGSAAREDIARRFSLDAMVTGMEKVFLDTVKGHASRRRGCRAHWQRFKLSVHRRWREWKLPRGYVRLGSRYGGWWLDGKAIMPDPLLIDCGLGHDISFPTAFLARFGGTVIGIDPNPQSLSYCRRDCPPGMQIWDKAFWVRAGETMTFHLPRSWERLPRGADGVSGSLDSSHAYVGGGENLTVATTSFEDVLNRMKRSECDVLKLDIEGAEFPVLEDLVARRLLSRTRQLLVEFHHGATRHTMMDTQNLVQRIDESGFRLMHTEGHNYIFRRKDLD
jgi:FkbM family methyltransferase